MQGLKLKVELSKSDVMRLGGQLGCDRAIGLPAIKGQRTVYFDTPEHTLDAAGFSLRLTRQDGHWSQTIKANRHAADGIAGPVELEYPVNRREPDITKITDKNIRRAIRKVGRGALLQPVFEAVVRRPSRKKSKLETIDGGAVRAGSAIHVREAELELKAQSAKDLLLAVEKLLGGHELKLIRQSKAVHGYRLPDTGKAGAKPEKVRPAPIARRNSCGQAFSTILASGITANRRQSASGASNR